MAEQLTMVMGEGVTTNSIPFPASNPMVASTAPLDSGIETVCVLECVCVCVCVKEREREKKKEGTCV